MGWFLNYQKHNVFSPEDKRNGVKKKGRGRITTHYRNEKNLFRNWKEIIDRIFIDKRVAYKISFHSPEKDLSILERMLKVSFTRRIDSNEHRNILPVSRGGELQTGEGEEEVVKNSSLITSPPFIHISREDSSLSLARGEKGRAGEEGEGETPRRVAIATPIIGCLQLPARLR